MKTLIFFFLMCVGLFTSKHCEGQKSVKSTVELHAGIAQIQSLSIGDKMPNIEIGKIVNHTKGFARSTDFIGKFVIIDFWSTWCTPCIKMFPTLDQLEKKFPEKLIVLPVTYEESDLVKVFLDKISSEIRVDRIMSIVEDSLFSKLFRHAAIPHYVWVDDNGIVKAITDSRDLTETNVEKFINGHRLGLKVKRDIAVKYDNSSPLFAGNQLEVNSQLLHQSTFTKYMNRTPNRVQWTRYWLDATNATLKTLYQLAIGEGKIEFMNDNRLVLEGFKNEDDSLNVGFFKRGQMKLVWENLKSKIAYNYEVVLNDSAFAPELKFQVMLNDLNLYCGRLGIRGLKEKRSKKVLSMVKFDSSISLSLPGAMPQITHNRYELRMTNLPIAVLVSTLQSYCSLPIEDNSDFKSNVSLQLTGDLTDVASIKTQLRKFGFDLINKDHLIDVVVIQKH